MYDYLKHHGFLYYIKYKNHLCGDVCLKYDGDLAITINNNYQNKHIGRRVIKKIILIAKYLGFKQVQAKIYTFNIQSQKMFLSIGFKKLDTEYYVYSIS
jgi:RimJ/RimL family protein N-acetyltransferase